MLIDGLPVKILRKSRNPKDIAWRENGVELVVDTTGAFNDPTTDPGNPGGALRGHLEAGAVKVMLSAPFKIKSKGLDMPGDAVTTVMGINPFPPSYYFCSIVHDHLPVIHDQTAAGDDRGRKSTQCLHGNHSCRNRQSAGARPPAGSGCR